MAYSADQEAEGLQYSLRSTFFYRRRRQWKDLLSEVESLDSASYDWGVPGDLGVSATAWAHVQRLGIPTCRVFCHPDVIASNAKLIAYYRLVSGLPQKGVERLAFGVGQVEQGRGRRLSPSRALHLSRVLNAHMSSIVDADAKFTIDDALLLGAMNFGAQINGSWRNEIGLEGSRRVKELIITYFVGSNLVREALGKSGPPSSPSDPGPMEDVQGITLVNGYSLAFGSEPDVSLRSPEGMLEAAVEVKAGLDPAGALERYGAAKKSFDRALRENKAATTIYLASCITEGVRKAMADDRLVRKEFDLTSIFIEPQAREEFLGYMRWLAHL